MIFTKICKKCNIEKELCEFHSDKKHKDGLKSGCKKCLNAEKKIYKKENRDKIKAQAKLYRQENVEKERERKRRWKKQNLQQFLRKRRNYETKKRANDPVFAMHNRIQKGISTQLKSINKRKSMNTHEYLGCSYVFFVSYLESLFLPGMNWENRNEWHIDHKKPKSWYNLINEDGSVNDEEMKKCWHYTNLKPMWWLDNLAKSNKWCD